MAISRDNLCAAGPADPPAGFAWFHVVLTVYGAWLPGDPRGFRTFGHREHVEGDYQSLPPSGKYTGRHARAQQLMKHPAVQLDKPWRSMVGEALVGRLSELGGFVMAAAVAGQHIHLLVKMPEAKTRTWAGAAKRHAWFELREQGWTGKLWAKRGKFTPVRDRGHQRNALRYILRHEGQGAWVWVHPEVSYALVEQLLRE